MKTKLGQLIKNYFPIYFSVLALIVACSSRSTGPDNEFDASVLEPMLTSLKPKVYFDESHNGQHTLSNTYQAFAKLVENDGCEVKSSNRAINNETLSDVNLYVTVAAKGQDDHGDVSPYSDEEINTLESWVNGGGSALIVTEHYPFGKAMSALLAKFGVEVHNGYTEDSLLENKVVIGALLFEKSKGNLNATHPILNQVEKINTFTGSSVKGDSTWIPLITFSPSGQNYNVKVNVIKDGGDVRTNI